MFDEYLMDAFYVPPKHFSIRKLNRTAAVIELWIQDQTTNLYFGTELHSKVYKYIAKGTTDPRIEFYLPK